MTWQRTRLKYLAALPITNGVGEPAEFDDPAWPRYIRTTDIGGPTVLRDDTFASLPPATAARAPVVRGDILMSAAGTIGRTYLHLTDLPACYAGYLVRFRPGPRVDPRFISFWAQATPFLDQVNVGAVRSTIDNFSAGKYQNLSIDVPSLAGQRAIVGYLDAETARIDALLDWRRRQRDAIAERLGSEVERRVLGLVGAPRSAAEASGYFTGRPPSWRETSLRHLGVEAQTGPFGSQLHAEEYVEGGTPVINPMHLVAGEIVPSSGMAVDEAKRRELSRHVLDVDDIVLARRGELGRVARVDAGSAGYVCGTGSMRLRLRQSPLRPGYLSMLLSSAPLRAYFETASVGSTMDNLSAETVLSAPVLMPSLSDQAEIEVAVARARACATEATNLISQQIDLLLERRQALSTAAVTGQLEIPGVAA